MPRKPFISVQTITLFLSVAVPVSGAIGWATSKAAEEGRNRQRLDRVEKDVADLQAEQRYLWGDHSKR